MADPTLFEIQGHSFKVAPLELDKSLRLFALMAPVLSLLAGAHAREPGAPGESPEHIVGALSNLPEVFAMFERVTKVRMKGTSVELDAKPLRADLFAKAPAMYVGFLVQCIKGEMSDFLPGGHGLNDVLGMVNA